MISIGSFICEHTFIVIHDLTVNCLLGADFLKKHEAVIDCKNGTLLLGTHIVPIHTGQQTTSSQVDSTVVVISTQEIPGRMAQLITCKVKGGINIREGLIEPSDAIGSLPKYLCVAQSLATVSPDNKVVLQVMNTNPSPVKVYRDMKLGQIIPRENILLVEQHDLKTYNRNPCIPEINLDSSILSSAEKVKVLDLITEYSDIFTTPGAPPAKSQVVKHTIKTQGPPIRQPLHIMPTILKDTINKGVTKMLSKE